MNEIIETETVKIEDKIYEIRGVQVILDRDLAKLYHIETKELMQSVKRNIKRFPEYFMFQLNKEEFLDWRSQFVTSKNDFIGLRRSPYAFTEHGVAMLSGLLRSDVAIKTNIAIINAFVKMRHFIIDNKDIYKSLNNMNNTLIEHDKKISYLFSQFDKKEELLLKDKPFTAYKTILDILNASLNEIIIIDNYADINILDLIRHIKHQVIIITKDSDRLSNIEINKYNLEYHNLKVIRDNSFHDRYIIIDKKEMYHCGCSINSIGDKISMISKIEDTKVKEEIISIIDNIMNVNNV